MSNDDPRDDSGESGDWNDDPDEGVTSDDLDGQSDAARSTDAARPTDSDRENDDRSGDRGQQREPAETKYCVECGASINAKAEICPECGVRQPMASSSDDDARIIAAVLAIVLGGFGAHKFYLGNTGMGILYICFSWTLIPSIVGIVEGAIYLSKSDEEFRAQYLDD